MDNIKEEETGEKPAQEVYRTYPRRWVVMLCLISLNMLAYCQTISFGPVAALATQYYKVSGDMIDLIPVVSMAINVPGMFVAVYCTERFGIKAGLRWGSICLSLGCTIRCLSTFPSYQDTMEPKLRFWLTFTGQTVVALGHPFLIIMSTQVSQVWFSVRERMVSTACMAGAPMLGALIGSILAPLIVNEDPKNIPLLNIVYPACALVGTSLAWVAVTTPHPITPPSLSAQRLREKPPLSIQMYFTNLKMVLNSGTMKSLLVLMGGGAGIFNTLATQFGQMLCATGYTSTQAGVTGGSLILSGFVGAFIAGPTGRKFNKLVEVSKICYSIASVGIIFLCITMRLPDMYWAVLLSTVIVGFFGIANFPISLELALEDTFPADPVISEAFIHMSGQLQAIFFILLGNIMHWDPAPGVENIQTCRVNPEDTESVEPWDYTPYYYLLIVTTFLGSIGYILLVNPKLRRTALDSS